MLQPKRTKFRKVMKGRNRGLAQRGSKVSLALLVCKLPVVAVLLRARSKRPVVQ